MLNTSPAGWVAAEVRAALARHSISHRAAADYLGISTGAMSRRMSGAVPFDVTELYALAELVALDSGAAFLPTTTREDIDR